MMTDGSIGGGDIKLVGLLGILYGASGLLAVLLASCLLVLLHDTFRRILKKKKLERIPFAPYLFWGCVFYINNQHHEVFIIINLLIQYAKTGDLNNLDGYKGPYLNTFYDCIPYIDDAAYDDPSSIKLLKNRGF